MARIVLGAVGAVIGAVTGGPVGAMQGFAIGSSIGGLLFPPEQPTIRQEGPRLGDLTVTSGAYGREIPFGIGTSRIAGDVIWCPGIKETVITHSESSGGKGFGGGQTVETTTYTYSVNCAVLICKGPAFVTRVWADGKLIIDSTGTGTLTEVPGLTYRFYSGTEDQVPDALIEADKGVGQVPAHRGFCYVVFEDFGLLNFAGQIPTFEFEVTKAGGSNYPVIISDLPNTAAVHVDEYRGLIYAYLDPDLVILDLFTLLEVKRKNIGSYTSPCIAGGRSGVVVYSAYLDVYSCSGYINKDTLDIKPFPIHRGPAILGLSGITQNSMAIVDTAISNTIVYRPWFGPMQAYSFARGDAAGGLGAILKDTDHYDATVQGVPGTFYFTGGLLDTLVMYGANRVHTLQKDNYHFRQFGAQSHTGNITLGKDDFEVGYSLSIDPLSGEASATVKLIVSGSMYTSIPSGNGINGGMFRDERSDTYILDNQVGLTGIQAQKIDPNTLTVISQIPSIQNYTNESSSDLSNQNVSTGHHWAHGSFAYDIIDQNLDDGSTQTTSLAPQGYTIDGGIYHKMKPSGGYGITGINGKLAKIFLGRFAPNGGANIRDYIEMVLEQCGYDPTLDADLTELDQTVYGYFTSVNTAGRSLIQPLSQLFSFDVVDSDYVLKFYKRYDRQSVATIKTNQMLVDKSTKVRQYTETIKQEPELPAQVALIYADPAKDYNQTTALFRRPSVPSPTMWSKSNIDISAPAALVADQAKSIVETILYSLWAERRSYSLGLDCGFLYLDPGDVITVLDVSSNEQTLQRIKGNDVGADLTISFDTVVFDSGTYSPSGIDADPGEGWSNTIREPQRSQMVLLDVPMLRDVDNIPLVYSLMAGYGQDGWRGGIAYMSSNGVDYKYRFGQNSEATIGILLDALPPTDRPFATDNETVVRAQIQTQSISMASVSQFDMLTNFANAAAVRSGTEWEIIQFRDCVQIDTNVFELSGILRGRKGTDYCTDDHKPYDQFVLLQPGDVTYTSFLPSDITKTFEFKCASPGQALSLVPEQILTYEGNSLRPYAPVHLAWTVVGSDLSLSWQRRTRFGGELASGTAGVDTGSVPLNEGSEKYRIVVKSGSTVLNTYDVTGAVSWLYTTAMQTADGFGPGAYVVVYQMSDLAGLGFPSRPSYWGINVDAAQVDAIVIQKRVAKQDVAQLGAVVMSINPEYAAVAELGAISGVEGFIADAAVNELSGILMQSKKPAIAAVPAVSVGEKKPDIAALPMMAVGEMTPAIAALPMIAIIRN